ncbi:MAG: zinc ribbon domain-containing protein [Actinomycetota bacterium]|nr:zinc ribbon domain-containing protein [Actinomycetota bacterium]
MGFLDKLKEQASSLGQQLDTALDGTKQKSQVGSLRKNRGELVAQLGEDLLNQFRQGEVDVETLRPKVDQIFGLENQIIEAEKQIEAQRQAAAQAAPPVSPPQAAQAQAAPPPPPSSAPQSEPAPPPAPVTAVGTCPSCGEQVPGESAFCPNCGSKVG